MVKVREKGGMGGMQRRWFVVMTGAGMTRRCVGGMMMRGRILGDAGNFERLTTQQPCQWPYCVDGLDCSSFDIYSFRKPTKSRQINPDISPSRKPEYSASNVINVKPSCETRRTASLYSVLYSSGVEGARGYQQIIGLCLDQSPVINPRLCQKY